MTHKVIIVPGLGDEATKIKLATNHWRKHGLDPVLYNFWWKKGNKHFEPELKKLVSVIDELVERGNEVSLVGASAGASAVLNAFTARRNEVKKAISVCGRLRRGDEKGLRSFEARTASSLAFRESVLMFEENEPDLTDNDRKKVMTIRALFDELVPDNTATIKGAKNTQIKSIEHVLSIGLALAFYRPLVDFLTDWVPFM